MTEGLIMSLLLSCLDYGRGDNGYNYQNVKTRRTLAQCCFYVPDGGPDFYQP